ncbi:hypothetical protein [Iningainema tapete]|uniref:Lipoprotein n=1 Tax=Iningainema tapete BLCC-T55 TaxID=2748662 RepID=A0A8J6XFM3_9CYAN|nr:hypothetical protein [Iningainema tapete]MBD2773138.1 hypothetical protein [Iningainema tapete BLCC-T55]
MKTKLLFACCIACVVSLTTACTENIASSSQTSVHTESSSDDMNNSTVFSSQRSSSDSSGYQHSAVTLSADDLRQPHILRINTSGSQLSGEITVNGRVVKRFTNNQEEINLSPLLSKGEHKVQISARYAPVSSSVSLELSSPDTNVSQQTSGNGIINYTLDLSVH